MFAAKKWVKPVALATTATAALLGVGVTVAQAQEQSGLMPFKQSSELGLYDQIDPYCNEYYAARGGGEAFVAWHHEENGFTLGEFYCKSYE